ncbi:MAG: hypothetical protein GQ582_05695 [Methyloprofundus sp.]|nr:hypothetical protein [Methyloprofundus sp.]
MMSLRTKFYIAIDAITDSKDYLKIEELKNTYAYKICARNAYVGIWIAKDQSFIISRYKVGNHPYLFNEYHWDIDTEGHFFTGTVKPLELVEPCPFELKSEVSSTDEQVIIDYLNQLEEKHPIVEGFNSLQHRKESAITFARRLSGDRFSNEQLFAMIKTDSSNKNAALELLKKRGYSLEDIETHINP